MVGYIFWIAISAAIAVWFMKSVEAQFAKAKEPMTATEGLTHFIVPFVMPIVAYALSSTIAGQIVAILFGVTIIGVSAMKIPGYVRQKVLEIATIGVAGLAQSINQIIGNLSIWILVYVVIMVIIAAVVATVSTDWDTEDISDDALRNIAVSIFCITLAVIAIMITANMLR